MKKLLFIAATAAVALSSCSSDEEIAKVQGTSEIGDQSIEFSVYANRQTRAIADPQNITISDLESEGFGVFAYEQGKQNLTSYLTTSTVPNFIYNDFVKKQSGEWKLGTAKYWPNNDDKVSFQAYAPYNENIKPIFDLQYKGVGIRYSSKDNYDLLWGYATNQTPAQCYEDQQKPSVTSKLDWTFQHALCRVDFSVGINVDELCTSPTKTLAEGTKVTIRSVKLIGKDGVIFPTQGVLSLYDGKWTVERTDADWGLTTSDLCHTTSIGNGALLADDNAGVFTETSGNVLYPVNPLMIIPSSTANAKAEIEIVYDVESGEGANYSCITNTVRSTDVVGTNPTIGHYPDSHEQLTDGYLAIEAGKYHKVDIHIGLTSAKFNATLVDWTGTNADIDMPANVNYKASYGLDYVPVLTYEAYGETDPKSPLTDQKFFNTTSSGTAKKYSGTAWETDTEVNGVIKAGGAYYEVTAGVGTAKTPTKLYVKGLKLYTNDGCTEVFTPEAGYYLIGTSLYKHE